ncbi:MAG TPA: hypothetical protein PLW65_25665 [Pseudomonadota bacterium]|nr:hypothetical protein [Pseudomonadota bacterium]
MQKHFRNLIAIGLALVLLGGAPRAGAHGGLPISQMIMWRGDSLLVPTPYWGIFVGTDGGPWRWICDEAINTNQLRLIAMASDGMTLYATDKTGLTLSPDGGCSWGPVRGPVAGLDVVSVVADPVLPRRAYVLANDSTMSANTGLWRTDDAGASWSLIRGLGTDLPGGLTLSYDGTQVAVTSLSQALPRTATLHLSTDSGAGFTGRALKVPLMGAALTNLSPVFFDTAPPGTGSLYLRTIVDPNQLLLRLDGFADPVVALSTPLQLRAMARDPETQVLMVGSSGGLFFQQPDSSFKLNDVFSSVQCLAPHGGKLYLCAWNYAPDNAAVARLQVSSNQPTRVFQYSQVKGPVDCPATTQVGSLCPKLWLTYADQLGVDLSPTPDLGGTEPPPPSSSCQLGGAGSGAASAGGLTALAAVLLALRRRLRRHR